MSGSPAICVKLKGNRIVWESGQLVQHGTFSKAQPIPRMQRPMAFKAVVDSLARLGEHTIHYPNGTDFHIPEMRALRHGSTPPAGPSHKLRETHFYLVLKIRLSNNELAARSGIDVAE